MQRGRLRRDTLAVDGDAECADRLERRAADDGATARLAAIPGIGPWSAAEPLADLGVAVADLSGISDIRATTGPRSARRRGSGGACLNGRVHLPVMPPVEPMPARSVPEIPVAEGMTYEPKWDGFRCLIFRDGDDVELASRGGKTLTRYFPEVVAQARAQLPERCVIDCELVVIRRDDTHAELDFELLQQRIHPAASRVRMLAERTPADVIAFDLLALGDESLMAAPYAQRRGRLVEALAT